MAKHTLVISLALLGCCACTSVPVEVRIDPVGVLMQSVAVSGRPATEAGLGLWRAKLPSDLAATGRVSVQGTSRGGVSATREGFIDAEQGGTVVLGMPAEIAVDIGALDAAQVLVGGQLVEPKDGEYVARISGSTGPVIVAASSKAGMRDQATVLPTPGLRTTVKLELEVIAAFKAQPDVAAFAEPIRFDASGSAPADRISRYTWDFGDGSTAEGPVVSHAYGFDPVANDYAETYAVTLTVASSEKHRASVTSEVHVHRDERDLRLELALYPTRADQHYRIGEPIQFVFEAAEGIDGATPEKLRLFFGDGESLNIPEAVLARFSPGGPRLPLVVEHAFAAEGRFAPQVAFVDGNTKPGDFRTAVLTHAGERAAPLVVTRQALATEQLLDAAWIALFEQIQRHHDRATKGLAGVRYKEVPLALTWLSDANFEIRDPLALATVERLTRLFVAAGYPVVERRSQVLSRLAHEAVVDRSAEAVGGQPAAAGAAGQESPADPAGGKPRYLSALDYSLRASNHGEQSPIVYDVAIDGLRDSALSSTSFASERRTTAAPAVAAAGSQAADAQAADDLTSVTHAESSALRQEHAGLVARFDTAEILLAVELLEQTPTYAIEPSVAYDEALDLPLDRHRVELVLRLRLVDRSGRILDTVDLRAAHEDLAPQGLRARDAEAGPLR